MAAAHLTIFAGASKRYTWLHLLPPGLLSPPQAQRAQPKDTKGSGQSDAGSNNQNLYLSVALSGAVFGVGLLFSGM